MSQPREVTEQGCRLLSYIIHISHESSADSITADFQTSSGINICTKPAHQELHSLAPPVGVCGPALLFIELKFRKRLWFVLKCHDLRVRPPYHHMCVTRPHVHETPAALTEQQCSLIRD